MKGLSIAAAVIFLYSVVASVAWFMAANKSGEDPNSGLVQQNEELNRKLAALDKENAKLMERMERLESHLAKANASKPAPAEPEELRDEFDDIFDTEIAKVKPAKTRNPTNELAKLVQGIVSVVTNSMSDTNSFLGNPEMRKAMRDQMQLRREGRIAGQYGDLLAQFDLDKEQRQEFISLLAKRGWGNRLWNNESNTNNAAPWMMGMQQGDQENVEEEIKEFLGDEGYAQYQQYEQTRYGRDEVNDFERTLGKGDQELSIEQHEQMVGIFNGMQELEQNNRRSFWSNGMTELSKEESDKQVEEQVAELEEGYNKVLEDSADVLDEDQLTALNVHLDNKLQTAESEAKTAAHFQQQMGGLFKDLGGGTNMIQPQIMIQTDMDVNMDMIPKP